MATWRVSVARLVAAFAPASHKVRRSRTLHQTAAVTGGSTLCLSRVGPAPLIPNIKLVTNSCEEVPRIMPRRLCPALGRLRNTGEVCGTAWRND